MSLLESQYFPTEAVAGSTVTCYVDWNEQRQPTIVFARKCASDLPRKLVCVLSSYEMSFLNETLLFSETDPAIETLQDAKTSYTAICVACTHLSSSFDSLLRDLGFAWSKEKHKPFNEQLEFILSHFTLNNLFTGDWEGAAKPILLYGVLKLIFAQMDYLGARIELFEASAPRTSWLSLFSSSTGYSPGDRVSAVGLWSRATSIVMGSSGSASKKEVREKDG